MQNGYALSFPIIKGEINEVKQRVDIKSLLGTAFPIGGNLYMTAGHVLEGFDKKSMLTIGIVSENFEWSAKRIINFEIREEFDIAIIEADHEVNEIMSWEETVAPNLTDIFLSGYPHGLDPIDKAIYRRDFKGYVITRRPFNRLSGRPYIYELSTPCPKGISGSYILNSKSMKICGIIIGNSKSSFDIYYETEEYIETEPKLVYHKTETSSYGIGITSNSIMNCQMKILNNGTLKEYLRDNNLLE